MKKMKIVLGIVIVIAFAFLYAFVDKATTIYDREIDNSKYIATGALNGKSVVQTFICEEDVLDGLTFKTQVTGDPKNTSLKYTVKALDSDQEVASGLLSDVKFENGKFYKIKFDQVKGCSDKNYEVSLTIDGGDAGNWVGVYYEPKQEGGTTFIAGGEEKNGTLILKTLSHRFDTETFVVFLCFVAYVTGFMMFLFKLFK